MPDRLALTSSQCQLLMHSRRAIARGSGPQDAGCWDAESVARQVSQLLNLPFRGGRSKSNSEVFTCVAPWQTLGIGFRAVKPEPNRTQAQESGKCREGWW